MCGDRGYMRNFYTVLNFAVKHKTALKSKAVKERENDEYWSIKGDIFTEVRVKG